MSPARRSSRNKLIGFLVFALLFPNVAIAFESTDGPELDDYSSWVGGLGSLNTASSDTLAPGTYALGISLLHADGMLRVGPGVDALAPEGGVIIDKMARLELGAALGLGHGVQLGLLLPFAQQSVGVRQLRGFDAAAAQGSSLGDARFHIQLEDGGRWSALTDQGVGLGIGLLVFAPTGSSGSLQGENQWRWEPRLHLDLDMPLESVLTVNIGYHIREERELSFWRRGDEIRWSTQFAFGTKSPLRPVVALFGRGSLKAETTGEHVDYWGNNLLRWAAGGISVSPAPLEIIGAFNYAWSQRLEVGIGLGMPVIAGIGTPATRGIVQLRYWSNPERPRRRRFYRRALRRDTDGDKINDALDRCPRLPEDGAGYRQEDGCPDVLLLSGGSRGRPAKTVQGGLVLPELLVDEDKDQDGVADRLDACPERAEDNDGFQDGDGCPEEDGDDDGIPDDLDQCPLIAENKNGVEDEDGCPEKGPDRDKDGVGDAWDRCPYAVGSRTDGCPKVKVPSNLLKLRRKTSPVRKQVVVPPTNEVVRPNRVAPSPPQPVKKPTARPWLRWFGDRDGDGIDDDKDLCPDKPENGDPLHNRDGCPVFDADDDGIADAKDQCALVAETANGIDDFDGCPDQGPDSDKDGIEDHHDRCPRLGETFNGHRDGDGCPEVAGPGQIELPAPVSETQPLQVQRLDLGLSTGRDLDGDGVIDTADACPNLPEDLDSYLDGDGCPDLDNDSDQIPDGLDRCPLVAETKNGYEDADGCPDREPQALKGIAGVVRGIRFAPGSDHLLPASLTVLERVAELLKTQPKMGLQIVGHTDDRGYSAANKMLSQSRADAVKRWLIAQGVEAARLQTLGLGAQQPISSNRDETGRAQNRRVELRYEEMPEADR